MESIVLSRRNGFYIEGIAPAGGIEPGRFCRWSTTEGVLEYDGGGVDNALPAAGMIAVEDSTIGKTINDVYPEGAAVRVVAVQPGDVVYARTASALSIGVAVGPTQATQNGMLANNPQNSFDVGIVLEPGVSEGTNFLTKVHII